ncbi:hypothetical protein [Natrinema versiforme]|uniref:Uncharacterized protein n=1 Tax=Natrinema versiforme TaxID=88724 RepID=A0A4P8WMD1_9EURY|nr:hypothetical protein [Natrinema versiforme]QCS44739.1 hypothetical protein FEJ81_20915 [Natrinema versiforme]
MDIDGEAQAYERDLLQEQEEYTSEHSNNELVNHLLAGISRLDTAVSTVNRRYSSYIDSRHEFQDIFVIKGVNALESLYISVKHRRYDSAYRDVRYLMETYLLVKHLNEHKIEASQIHSRQMVEVRDEVEDMSLLSRHRVVSVDRFYEMIREEKQNYKEFDDGLQTFNFLSNRSAHPHRIVGARLDGEHVEDEERQVLEWGLDLLTGLCIEYAKLYADTPAFTVVRDLLRPLFDALEEVHEPQNFLELSLSDPIFSSHGKEGE